MIGRRAVAAGITTKPGNHSFRATGITAYLKNGGTLEKPAAISNHASTRTTQLYDRPRDEVSLDEVEPFMARRSREISARFSADCYLKGESRLAAKEKMSDTIKQNDDIKAFFKNISPLKAAYHKSFAYVAVRHDDGTFVLLKGIIFFNTTESKVPFTHFQSENIRGGHYRLSALKIDAQRLLSNTLTGKIETPQGSLTFPAGADAQGGAYTTTYLPFHPFGLQNQHRLNVLRISGAPLAHYTRRQPFFDWELKAAATPYDGLQELMSEHQLGILETDSVTFEAIAFNVALVNFGSPVSGTTARVTVHLAKRLPPDKAAVGYRVFSQGRVVTRSMLKGRSMQWTDVADYQQGIGEIHIPNAAVLHCVVSYAGIAQYHGWLADPATFSKPTQGYL